jgi:hypothetical protein
MTGKEKKIQRSYMLSSLCLECLDYLKANEFPELSYSQIVDKAIVDYAIRLRNAK